MGETSRDIKQQIKDFTSQDVEEDQGAVLDEGPDYAPDSSPYGVEVIPSQVERELAESEGEEDIQTEEQNEDGYADSSDPIYQGLVDQKREKERQQRERFENYQYNPPENYEEPSVSPGTQAYKQKMEQQQALNHLNQALTMDQVELTERYGPELTQQFFKDAQFGRIKLPKGLEKVENAMEHVFLDWVGSPKVRATLGTRDLKDLLTRASSGQPLKCRSLDFLIPQRKQPEPKPKKARAKKEFSVADLSMDDMKEAIGDFLKKHPERR